MHHPFLADADGVIYAGLFIAIIALLVKSFTAKGSL